MAVAVVFVAKTSTYLTKNVYIGISVGVWYGLLYPVWLYAIVPEVFGMLSMMSAIIIYYSVRILGRFPKTHEQVILALLAGLSLTHHHIASLLFIPLAILYGKDVFIGSRDRVISWYKIWVGFFIGCIPLFYTIVLPMYTPAFLWEQTNTLPGFFRMLFRAAYGTFRSSSGSGNSMVERMLDVQAFLHYMGQDITILGIILIVIGVFWYRQKNRTTWVYVVGMFLFWVFFFFYSGFHIRFEFNLGTIERFFIVPYQYVMLLISIGIAAVLARVQGYMIGRIFFFFLIVLLPGYSFFINYPRLKDVRIDRTVENFGIDLLAHVPKGALVMLSTDVPQFPGDFAYYVLRVRPDIRYVKIPLLQMMQYRIYIRKTYPDVVLPDDTKLADLPGYVSDFFALNTGKFAIFSEQMYLSAGGFWIPDGLLMRYYPVMTMIPKKEDVVARNDKLFATYHDPQRGMLATYKHLLPSSIISFMAEKKTTYADLLVGAADAKKTSDVYESAIQMDPGNNRLYDSYFTYLLAAKQCDRVTDMFVKHRALMEISQAYTQILDSYETICPDAYMSMTSRGLLTIPHSPSPTLPA